MKVVRNLFIMSFFATFPIASPTTIWTNWGKNQYCTPANLYHPSTIKEVQTIIRNALKKNETIRFFATSHSWSALINCNDSLIDTKKFNHVLSINLTNNTIRVESGTIIKDVVTTLAEHGLALSNQGFITAQTIGGAICTATHGTGKTGTLSDFVLGVDIVDGLGNYHSFNRQEHPDILKALSVNIGTLGFIYAVTLQCEPLFLLKHQRNVLSWDNFNLLYDELYETHDYCMFMAHPTKQNGLFYSWNRTNEPLTRNFATHLPETILMSKFTQMVGPTVVRTLPELSSEFINNIWFKALEKKDHIEYSYKSLSPIAHPYEFEKDYIESEIAIPFQHFNEAINTIRELFVAYEQAAHPIVGFITIRFCPGFKHGFLNPNYGRKTAYINLTIINHFPVYECFKEFAELMKQYNGRPHWAKIHFLDKDYLHTVYGNTIDTFNQIREQLDPHHIFSNKMITKLFD